MHCRELKKEKDAEIEAKIEKDIDELMKKHWFFRPKDRKKARQEVVYDNYVLPWRKPDYRNFHDDNFSILFELFKSSKISNRDFCLLNTRDAGIVETYLRNKKD